MANGKIRLGKQSGRQNRMYTNGAIIQNQTIGSAMY